MLRAQTACGIIEDAPYFANLSGANLFNLGRQAIDGSSPFLSGEPVPCCQDYLAELEAAQVGFIHEDARADL